MYGIDFFKDFKLEGHTVITNSPKVHYCSVCGSKLFKRKVRIIGYTADNNEFKKAFFCANSECWGEVKKLFKDDDPMEQVEIIRRAIEDSKEENSGLEDW
jgi:hypothetical protein